MFRLGPEPPSGREEPPVPSRAPDAVQEAGRRFRRQVEVAGHHQVPQEADQLAHHPLDGKLPTGNRRADAKTRTAKDDDDDCLQRRHDDVDDDKDDERASRTRFDDDDEIGADGDVDVGRNDGRRRRNDDSGQVFFGRGVGPGNDDDDGDGDEVVRYGGPDRRGRL